MTITLLLICYVITQNPEYTTFLFETDFSTKSRASESEYAKLYYVIIFISETLKDHLQYSNPTFSPTFSPYWHSKVKNNFQTCSIFSAILILFMHPRIPTVKLKIPRKAFLKSESWTSVTFKLQFLTLAIYHGSVLAKSQQLPLVDS